MLEEREVDKIKHLDLILKIEQINKVYKRKAEGLSHPSSLKIIYFILSLFFAEHLVNSHKIIELDYN